MFTAVTNLFPAIRLSSQICVCSFSAQPKTGHQHRLPTGYNSPTAFALYVQKNSTTGETAAKGIKKVAKTWHELSNTQKEEYRQKALAIGEERKLAFKKLSETEQFNLRQSESLSKQQRVLRTRRKIIRTRNEKSGRPKMPPNAFAIFLSENLKGKICSKDERKQLFLKTAASWKALLQVDRAKYEVVAIQKKNAYFNKLEEWQKHVDLVQTEETKQLLNKFKKLQAH